MERGPLALFGAIVAVGLGPALWLGAQFGGVQVQPARPPIVSERNAAPEQLLGGAAGGKDTTGAGDTVLRTTPRAQVATLTRAPSSAPTVVPVTTDPSPAEPTTTGSTEPGGDDPSIPAPTPTTDDPVPTPTGDDGTGHPTAPPAPPTGDSDPSTPSTDQGGVGAGESTDS